MLLLRKPPLEVVVSDAHPEGGRDPLEFSSASGKGSPTGVVLPRAVAVAVAVACTALAIALVGGPRDVATRSQRSAAASSTREPGVTLAAGSDRRPRVSPIDVEGDASLDVRHSVSAAHRHAPQSSGAAKRSGPRRRAHVRASAQAPSAKSPAAAPRPAQAHPVVEEPRRLPAVPSSPAPRLAPAASPVSREFF